MTPDQRADLDGFVDSAESKETLWELIQECEGEHVSSDLFDASIDWLECHMARWNAKRHS